jgi:hypothetical protein
MGIDAQPMHVALGLEPNANDRMDDSLDDDYVELPPVLVTFEGEHVHVLSLAMVLDALDFL